MILYKAHSMKDLCGFVSILDMGNSSEIVGLFENRFKCEESFHDIKHQTYGFWLRFASRENMQRRGSLLQIVAIAYVHLMLIDLRSQLFGIDRIINAVTGKKRRHSMFRLFERCRLASIRILIILTSYKCLRGDSSSQCIRILIMPFPEGIA